jgi:hypothetical protein
MSPTLTPIRERILRSVVVDGNGCWIWQLSRVRRYCRKCYVDGLTGSVVEARSEVAA